MEFMPIYAILNSQCRYTRMTTLRATVLKAVINKRKLTDLLSLLSHITELTTFWNKCELFDLIWTINICKFDQYEQLHKENGSWNVNTILKQCSSQLVQMFQSQSTTTTVMKQL